MTITARAALLSAVVLCFVATDACAAPAAKAQAKPAADKVIAVDRAPEVPMGALKSAWTQYGPDGVLEVRAVIEAQVCPDLVLDLTHSPMTKRAGGDAHFLTVCAATIPSGTKQAALAFGHDQVERPQAGAGAEALASKPRYGVVPLALATPDPQRILVLGDTGCRIKGKSLQDCSSPEAWPFPTLAAKAARLKPDLVIHVGDYLYREQACPADFPGCQGTPFGDNWPTWDADFFAPAAPLLAAAPWVMVRGNHEDCKRAGPGFLRLLGPQSFDAAAACSEHLAPFSIPLKGLNLVVADNADAPETSTVDASVPVYRQEIAALANAPSPTWWLLHRPIWGLITGPLGLPVGGNLTLMAAVGEHGIPSPVSLMLSGHIHSFEAINYESAKPVPPQIVAGFGGDMLDPTPTNLRGAIFQGSSGVHVKDGLSIGGFGFLLLSKTTDSKAQEIWTVDVYDGQGRIQRQCLFQKGRVDCPTATKPRR